jgi:hypothetical protein
VPPGRPLAASRPYREPPRPRGARSASLLVRRVEPLSVLRVALIGAVGFVVTAVVLVTTLYALLDVMGVFDTVGGLSKDVGATRTSRVIPLSDVLGWTALVTVALAAVGVAVSTLVACVYNLVNRLVGGPEVTLVERR